MVIVGGGTGFAAFVGKIVGGVSMIAELNFSGVLLVSIFSLSSSTPCSCLNAFSPFLSQFMLHDCTSPLHRPLTYSNLSLFSMLSAWSLLLQQ